MAGLPRAVAAEVAGLPDPVLAMYSTLESLESLCNPVNIVFAEVRYLLVAKHAEFVERSLDRGSDALDGFQVVTKRAASFATSARFAWAVVSILLTFTRVIGCAATVGQPPRVTDRFDSCCVVTSGIFELLYLPPRGGQIRFELQSLGIAEPGSAQSAAARVCASCRARD